MQILDNALLLAQSSRSDTPASTEQSMLNFSNSLRQTKDGEMEPPLNLVMVHIVVKTHNHYTACSNWDISSNTALTIVLGCMA